MNVFNKQGGSTFNKNFPETETKQSINKTGIIFVVAYATILNMKLSVSDIFNLSIGRTTNIINKVLQREFKKIDLPISHDQWIILSALWQENGLSQQSLSDRTFKDKTSITRLIDKLEAHNLVIRVADKNDLRTNLIYLTKKGESFKDITTPIITDTYQKAIRSITEEEILICKKVLNQVYENIKDDTFEK